ncbi:hypothetical protein A1O3_06279 [Capronia epimyces CBS 606.96]|uniref:Uncharacterized protein n=1 Tax=Capronia epimyces CBS 606.96 TaxID=1182542 RepID=W9XZR9_9EURO|nr:uncharacterized protein A1O3_06279 [Capronia epimyces CBS 606.96]EXJ82466.1 hypothetical protein A1O3_06279 [Capronia epimyces CBS 606.96]
MGTSQKFRLPSTFRREKSRPQPQNRPSDGKESKAQHILGITGSALNTARNESISSSTTARVPRLSLSDATTEFGSVTAPIDNPEPHRDLHLKASSVLLHEDYRFAADGARSIRSARLKASGSSSTLHSHYDAQKTPLSISQQTSDSSRRDFALRKGLPVVVQSTTPDQDSLRQLRLFRSSKNRDKPELRKITQQGPRSPVSPARTLFGSQRSLTPSEQGPTSPVVKSLPPAMARNPVLSPPRSQTRANKLGPSMDSAASRAETSQVKVNIRRPKVGVKHWFDGLEGDSSEDESIHEPELQPSFVVGMEMAFEDGKIGPVSEDSSQKAPSMSENSGQGAGSMPLKASAPRHALPSSAIPPRTSTLNAKSSRPTIRRNALHQVSLPPSKPKPSSLASTDLHQTSVLDLSSSEDDEPQPARPHPTERPLPQLRDSIAVESLMESEIEIGTAQAIDTKQTSSVQATPSLRRVYGSQARRHARPSMNRHSTVNGQRLTYFSDRSSEPAVEDNDLLTSFPATPTDPPCSHRTSFQGSFRSDTASIESRRLISVTRQEESLLAAMRLRKLASSKSNGSSASRQKQIVGDQEQRRPGRHYQTTRSPVGQEISALAPTRKVDVAPSISSANFDRDSFTTFQTGMSNDPSVRFSFTSFQTDTSLDPETERSLSLGMTSPMLLAHSRSVHRMSRATFFSTSTSDSRDGSCSRRETRYLSNLEKLQTMPKREEISSQDFIDFPYHGWEAKSRLAAAAAAAD